MDRYVKIRKIGEGSFGKALLVRSKENGKQMVVKEINMSRMQRKEREEARKEVAVLAQLQHPNIVAYRESFEETGNLFIVMDFCDGGDLYSRINAQRGVLFAEDVVLDWFVQTCLAIKHIHDRKILHRDIKSQNIFLTRHGMVKLGDFGIAKVLNSTVELARTCIGTPYYLSPEICENKPYNNKSDVWSLGCVLYELTTLKHAFEAGNMKNLVLKIIRGSYPPPPSRYSYELRSLISTLFKRSPRDRPSMNSILKKPLLQSRIRRFLSESEICEEFSHTVMHGVKLKKQLPVGGPRPLPPKPVAAKKPPTPRYDPVSVYAPSAARKSKESRQSAEGGVRKSSAGNVKRPPSGGVAARIANNPSPMNGDLGRKRQELIDKEKKRQEEAKKKEQHYAKAHRDLLEKQRMNRIMKAREEGWKGLMDSLSSDDSNKKLNSSQKSKASKNSAGVAVKKDEARHQPAAQKPVPSAGGGKDKGNYDQYHAWLNKVEAERKNADRPATRPAAAAAAAAAGGVPGALGGGAAFNPAEAARMGQKAGLEAARAADKAKLQEEFMLRKREAALYKARAQGDIYGAGGAAAALSPRVAAKPPVASPANRPVSACSDRDAQEEEYLARLRQIRLQNFNERRAVKGDVRASKDQATAEPGTDQDARKKKIEALRAQADERAKKLKEELERKRKESYELEKKKLREKRHERPSAKSPDKPTKPSAPFKPAPAIPMTEAMKAIGAVKEQPKPVPSDPAAPSIGMTAALQAIGAAPKQPAGPLSPSEELPEQLPTVAKSQIQKKKAQILKRLNAKPPFGNNGAPAGGGERGKWGEPVKPAVTEAERPKWGEEGPNVNVLSQISLEETASGMEATSAQDVVIKHSTPHVKPTASDTDEAPISSRKQWAGPRGTVINALQHANLSDTQTSAVSDSSTDDKPAAANDKPINADTITISKTDDKKESHETKSSSGDESYKAPAVGSTITITRSVTGGTVVVKKDGDKSETAVSMIAEEDEPTEKSEESSKQTTVSAGSSPVSQRSRSRSHSGSPQVKKRETTPDVVAATAAAARPLFNRVELEDQETSDEKTEADMEIEDVEENEEKGETEETEKEQRSSMEDAADDEKALAKTLSGKGTSLALGLTTGHFDVDVKMLRTCSEPDLSKLFKTVAAEKTLLEISASEVAASLDTAGLVQGSDLEEEENGEEYGTEDLTEVLQQQLAEEEEDDESPQADDAEKADSDRHSDKGDSDKGGSDIDAGKASDESGHDADEDKEKEDDCNDDQDDGDSGGDDTDEDLETLRETMRSILEKEDGGVEPEALETASTKKKKKTVKKTKSKTTKKIKKKSAEQDSKPLTRQWSDGSVEELKTMRATMQSLLQPDNDKSKLQPVIENGGGDAKQTASYKTSSTIVPGRESWQDDDDGDDDYFEEEDMFSRLEETRAKLEEELGCNTFLQAYKTVQALHEDEDEDMEQGVQLVTKILGDGKVHLYPSILQLVMADGAFTEDND